MKTASFFTYAGAGRISIARYAPRGTPAGFRIYRPLAPGPWFASVRLDVYRELYFEQLAALDPQRVHDDLHELAAGAEPVLLCYESARDCAAGRTFCHRHMVAEWLAKHLGITVAELTPHST